MNGNENNGTRRYSDGEDLIQVINSGSKSRVASKKRRISGVVLGIFVGLSLFAITFLVAANTVFRINEIHVEGCDYYSEEEILERIGIHEGDSIFFVREKKLAERLSSDYPMVYSLKLEKEFPSRVNVKITEEMPSYTFDYSGEQAVVSKMGKIIYLGDKIPEEFQGVMRMEVPEVASAVEGFVIQYRDEKDWQAVDEVLTKLRESPFADQIVFVKMNSRFDIKVSYGERFTILFGDRSDLDVKIKFVDGIIKTLEKGENGTINVKNPKKGYLILE